MGIGQARLDTTLINHIEKAIDELRPYIQGHGGNISFMRFEKGIVYIKLSGACETCPFSLITLKMGVEERLKALVPQVTEVELAE